MYEVTDEMNRRIEQTFTYHGVLPDQVDRYQEIRAKAKAMALDIVRLTPPSREQSLALTKLEEAIMFANAAIARNEGAPPES